MHTFTATNGKQKAGVTSVTSLTCSRDTTVGKPVELVKSKYKAKILKV
jgi:hypothetical protein